MRRDDPDFDETVALYTAEGHDLSVAAAFVLAGQEPPPVQRVIERGFDARERDILAAVGYNERGTALA